MGLAGSPEDTQGAPDLPAWDRVDIIGSLVLWMRYSVSAEPQACHQASLPFSRRLPTLQEQGLHGFCSLESPVPGTCLIHYIANVPSAAKGSTPCSCPRPYMTKPKSRTFPQTFFSQLLSKKFLRVGGVGKKSQRKEKERKIEPTIYKARCY